MTPARRWARGIITCTLLALVSGCEFHCSVGGPSEPRVGGPLTSLPSGDAFPEADDVNPVYTDTETFYVVWGHPDAAEGDTVTARMVAVDVGPVAPAGTQVLEVPHTLEADQNGGYFSFTRPALGWPPGRYRVQVVHGTETMGSVEFDITRR